MMLTTHGTSDHITRHTYQKENKVTLNKKPTAKLTNFSTYIYVRNVTSYQSKKKETITAKRYVHSKKKTPWKRR